MIKPNPKPGHALVLGSQTYIFQGYDQKIALPAAYAQTGRKGTVYKLQDSNGQDYALKVFLQPFRQRRTVTIGFALQQFSMIPRIRVWKRQTLTRQQFPDVIAEHPELEYAVLMPWVTGTNWENYWQKPGALVVNAEDGLQLARQLSESLAWIEGADMAHCDIAGSNVMVDVQTRTVEIVDIEDAYIPGLESPPAGHIPAGTPGYQHRTSRAQGQWGPHADRYAAGLLLAEFVTWHEPEIRSAAGDGALSYFEDADLVEPSPLNPRFLLLKEVLATSSTSLADLLSGAWTAPTLEDCPRLRQWQEALWSAQPARRLAQPLPAPKLQPTVYGNSGSARLSWPEVKNASEYRIELADDAEFFSMNSCQTVCDPRWVVKDLPYRLQFCRVQAGNKGRWSAWSQPIAFGRLQTPSPKASSDGDEWVVHWAPVANATAYELSCDDTWIEAGSVTSYRIPALAPGEYTIRVRARAQVETMACTISSVSDPVSIRVLPAAPSAMTITADGFRVFVSWDPVPFARTYQITVSQDDTDLATDVIDGTSTAFDLAEGTYTISVRVAAEPGFVGSAIQDSVEVLCPLAPKAWTDTSTDSATFRWEPVGNASEYHVEITKPDGTVSSRQTTGHFLNVPLRKQEVGLYQLRVAAVFAVANLHDPSLSDEVVGPFSEPVEVIKRPVAPTWQPKRFVVSPNEATLAWGVVTGAHGYRVYFAPVQSPPDERSIDCNVTQLPLLLDPGTYIVHVVAYIGQSEGPRSLPRQITIPAATDASDVSLQPSPAISRMKSERPDTTHDPVFAGSETIIRSVAAGDDRTAVAFDRDHYVVDLHVGRNIEVTFHCDTRFPIVTGSAFQVETSDSPEFVRAQRSTVSDRLISVASDTVSRLFLRVRAVVNGQAHQWSPSCTVDFGYSAPEEAKLSVNGRGIKVKWNCSDAEEFEAEVAADKRFANATLYGLDDGTHISVNSGTHYVRMRARFDGGWSVWTTPQRITVERDSLASPVFECHRTQVRACHVSWQAVPGAKLYSVSTGPDAVEPNWNTIWAGEDLECLITVPPGPVWIRLSATDGAIESASEMPLPELAFEAPELTQVTEGAVCRFTWTEVTGADGYRLTLVSRTSGRIAVVSFGAGSTSALCDWLPQDTYEASICAESHELGTSSSSQCVIFTLG